jgi:hypothetical protein
MPGVEALLAEWNPQKPFSSGLVGGISHDIATHYDREPRGALAIAILAYAALLPI